MSREGYLVAPKDDLRITGPSKMQVYNPVGNILIGFRGDMERIKMTPQGDFYYKGELIANDVEVYKCMRDFFGLSKVEKV